MKSLAASDPRAEVLGALSLFIRRQGFEVRVLNGLDPQTGELGRDLDVLVRERRERDLLLRECAAVLRRSGARWVVSMHPIWGPRCIGVWPDGYRYFEWHMLPALRCGPLDAEQLFGVEPHFEAFGMCFAPGLSFFKQMISRNGRRLLRGEPLGEPNRAKPWLQAHAALLADQLRSCVPSSGRFVDALFGEDSDANRRERRRGVLWLFGRTALRHPGGSARRTLLGWGRRVRALASPCSPAVLLQTEQSCAAVQAALAERLRGIFLAVQVSPAPLRWLQRQQMRAHQQLSVCRIALTEDPAPRAGVFDLTVRWPSGSCEGRVDSLCEDILTGVEQLNARWMPAQTPQGTSL